MKFFLCSAVLAAIIPLGFALPQPILAEVTLHGSTVDSSRPREHGQCISDKDFCNRIRAFVGRQKRFCEHDRADTAGFEQKPVVDNAMGKQALLDDNAFEWEKATSFLGRPFEIGRKKCDQTIVEKKEPAAGYLKSFGLSVNWPPGSHAWKPTEPEVVATAGITRYSLYNYSAGYDYQLWFDNAITYDYVFYDQGGDSYRLRTYRKGDHFIRWDTNSYPPIILFITGT